MPLILSQGALLCLQVAWLKSLGLGSAFGSVSGSGIGWAGLVVVVAVAAAVTLAVGMAAYHFRMRAHAQHQIKEIMCACLMAFLYMAQCLLHTSACIMPIAYSSVHNACCIHQQADC